MNHWRALIIALLAVALTATSIACEDEEEPTPVPTRAPAVATPVPAQPTATPTPPTATPEPTATATPRPEPTATPQPDQEVLTILYWQAPTLPFPYQASGFKDRDAGAIVLEPLAVIDPNGNPVARLAEEIPSAENGGISEDGLTITWRLRENLKWSDGSDLTADDVVFTWLYCTTEGIGCLSEHTFSAFKSVEAVGDREVVFTLGEESRNPVLLLAGTSTPIISKAQFEDCIATATPNCDEQHRVPIGSGPYQIVEFSPNDRAVFERNPHYWGGRPHFDRVELIGGGDAESAAQAVLIDGTADYAWNLQVTPAQLNLWVANGRGEIVTAFASDVERIVVNQTNPHTENVDHRSEYLDGENPHPFLTFTPIRKAMSMAIDRQRIVDDLYGSGGEPTCNLVTAPERFVSERNDGCLVQDIEGAKALLDEEGVIDSDGDGIREYNGVPLSLTYQTTVNAVREGTFVLIQGWWAEIGIESQLITHDASIFFGGDPADVPESYRRFLADVQMYTTGTGLDPASYFSSYQCDHIQSRENMWAEENNARLCNKTYDWLYMQLDGQSESAREATVRALNDAIVRPAYEIPLVNRGFVSAKATSLQGIRMNAWDSELWNIADWSR
ncbi:MAG: peptide ABC transporter substrate-binding protein [Chloroflexi bacterium]|nr:peptide ABC transporter substrate-binding protein [Chloroflexota bacterium]